MEPKYAALVQIVWYTDRHHHVVHQKYWELRSVDSLCGQQLEQNREYGVDVDNSQRSAGAEKTRRNGKSLVCREYKVNGREHVRVEHRMVIRALQREDRKSTRLNSSHVRISYAVFCLKKKKKT